MQKLPKTQRCARFWETVFQGTVLGDREGAHEANLTIISGLPKTAVCWRDDPLLSDGIPVQRTHDLRHTFAKNEYLSGSDVIAIRSAGGWKSTAMVDLYIGELEIANEDLKRNQEV